MANFETSNKITDGNEGGYNPGIGEKETYKGIDRGANPRWSGWPVIDGIKNANPGITTKKMNALLGANPMLQQNIKSFYKANYWQPVSLDYVNDQQLANNLYDCSVNQGEGRARQIFQAACNFVIHETGSKLPLLQQDGKIGRISLDTINKLPADLVMAEINKEREAWYRVARGYAQWGKVWEARLIPYKKTA